MLFRETNALAFGDHMERTRTLCGHSAEFRNVTISSTYGYHLALKMKVTGLVGLLFL